ncbi:MAG: hypothetical protein ACKOTB_03040 [Planctomycetia bacterium]
MPALRNLFDTLFPPRSRLAGAPSRPVPESRSRRRRPALGLAERLENRWPLAITTNEIVRTSASDFLIDTSLSPDTRDMLCNDASFQITNKDNGDPIDDSIDVWVQATDFSNPKIGLADDGLMHVGMLKEGVTKGAFFYLKSTAGEVLGLNETYAVKVYGSDPRISQKDFITDKIRTVPQRARDGHLHDHGDE